MPRYLRDNQLKNTTALPNGAANVKDAGFDTGKNANGDQLFDGEILIEAPALATGQLADAATMTYSVWHDTDPAFGTEVLLADKVLVQTGAGGAGAALASARFALPSTANRYLRVRATNSAAGNASAASMTTSIVV